MEASVILAHGGKRLVTPDAQKCLNLELLPSLQPTAILRSNFHSLINCCNFYKTSYVPILFFLRQNSGMSQWMPLALSGLFLWVTQSLYSLMVNKRTCHFGGALVNHW